MNSHSDCVRGTYATLKRAWLLTWKWADRHAKVEDKFAAVISWRYSGKSVERIVERIYVSDYLTINGQFAYAKSKRHCLYKIQYNTVAVSEKMQKECSLPAQARFSDSMIIGGNPWLWARVVYDLETWIDVDGFEHLRWRERENLVWEDGEIRSDWQECCLKRKV